MSEQVNAIVGIDMSKQKFDAALLRDNKFKHKVFANTKAGHEAMVTWLHKNNVPTAHVCMESTNVYGEALAEHLFDRGYKTRVRE